MKAKKGIPVSPGVAIGQAYCIDDIYVDSGALVDPTLIAAELARFEEACKKSAADLRALYTKVARQVGEDEAAIFKAHETVLQDQTFKTKIRRGIAEHRQTAQAALQGFLKEYAAMFSRTDDEYLKDRLADLRDVILRLSAHLSPALQKDSQALPGPLIVVAHEVLPSQALVLGEREVSGIVTRTGGQTSHAAILARSRGIPAVSGVQDILSLVKNGDTLIVDGRAGHVILRPDSETVSAYLKLQREFVNLKDALAENREQPAISQDGARVQLLANINSISDAKATVAMGGDGVGLFRTEYLFLTHPDVPDEEEQLAYYQQIVASSPPGPVTIRTLDIGGDKSIAYLGTAREANPFMGWRSIRLSFEHPQFFLAQLRAILRCGGLVDPQSGRQVRMLFPMITTLDEVRKVKSLVRKARRQVQAAGHPLGDVPIGLMVEVPVAALAIRSFLTFFDYVSIGSNDLVQYLNAADRDNPKVAHLCQPLSPPVLRVLYDVITACNEAEKPLTLCGEMAGAPRGFVLLFAMGLRSFSMSPSIIPTMKELLKHICHKTVEQLLKKALKLQTASQVNRFLSGQLSEFCPSLKLMDS